MWVSCRRRRWCFQEIEEAPTPVGTYSTGTEQQTARAHLATSVLSLYHNKACIFDDILDISLPVGLFRFQDQYDDGTRQEDIQPSDYMQDKFKLTRFTQVIQIANAPLAIYPARIPMLVYSLTAGQCQRFRRFRYLEKGRGQSRHAASYKGRD